MWSREKPRVDWVQPFPAEEFSARRERVAESPSAKGLDALFVSNPVDIYYLTGYDMIWFHLRCLTGCLLTAGAELTFFDHPGHRTLVETTPDIQNIRWIEDESVAAAIRTVVQGLRQQGLRQQGLEDGRVGDIWVQPEEDIADERLDVRAEWGR